MRMTEKEDWRRQQEVCKGKWERAPEGRGGEEEEAETENRNIDEQGGGQRQRMTKTNR